MRNRTKTKIDEQKEFEKKVCESARVCQVNPMGAMRGTLIS